MKKPKIHYIVKYDPICGKWDTNLDRGAVSWKVVTCKRCLKLKNRRTEGKG